MEIVAGELSCYQLLAFISLNMEVQWRGNPVGKVLLNLPFFKKFTQKIDITLHSSTALVSGSRFNLITVAKGASFLRKGSEPAASSRSRKKGSH